MKLKKLICGMLTFSMLVLSVPTSIFAAENAVLATASTLTEIKPTPADTRVIPDARNTGCSATGLKKVSFIESETTLNGICFNLQDAQSAIIYYARNTGINGTYVFENMDFSNYTLLMYDMSQYQKPVTLVFKNCKFASVRFPAKVEGCKMNFKFENCSFNFFLGSNAEFNHCRFGGTYRDGLTPFQNVTVNDCYFCDFTSTDMAGNGFHTDGMQVYGYEDVMVKNVYFNNTRFELPPVPIPNGAYINACIMLQMEYNNAENIHFTDCIVNGGGYAIYARPVKDAKTMDDVSFDNILIGNAERYGTVISGTPDSIAFNNMQATSSLYISSVWKSAGKTHLTVTNDTGRERTLKVVTNTNVYTYKVAACPDGETIVSTVSNISQLPIDKDIVVPEDCKYIVCYDTTFAGSEKQIRFVNWGTDKVYVNESSISAPSTQPVSNIVLEGSCGKNVKFVLYTNGTLVLSGTGDTYNYYLFEKPAPWFDYRDMIQKVIVEDGITSIGTQMFSRCFLLSNTVLGKDVATIGARAFAQCSMLNEISIPLSLTMVENNAFSQTLLQYVYYPGTEAQWNKITVGTGNDEFLFHRKPEKTETEDKDPVTEDPSTGDVTTINSGMCGKNVYYNLTSDGVLTISGEGAMYTFYDGNRPGYYAYRDKIQTILVKGTVSEIGSQAFALLPNLERVTIEEGVTKIQPFAFNHDTKLKSIDVPATMTYVGTRAFADSAVEEVKYYGTQEQWNKITILEYNELFVKAMKLSVKEPSTPDNPPVTDPSDPGNKEEDKPVENYTVVNRGTVGKSASYELRSDGKLIISGTGSTNTFYEGNRPGFYTYKDKITEVIVEKGITNIGSQTFALLPALKKVTLPEGLERIESFAFNHDTMLKTISVPDSVTYVGTRAFANTGLTEVLYYGTQEQWKKITILEYNDPFINSMKLSVKEPSTPDNPPVTDPSDPGNKEEDKPVENYTVINRGTVGKNASYELRSDGKLIISGTGATDTFYEGNRPSFYTYKDKITEVIVEKGITVIGSQAFALLPALKKVTLPDGLERIESFAFNHDYALSEISVPATLKYVGSRAFAGAPLAVVSYNGTSGQLAAMTILDNNEAFTSKLLPAQPKNITEATVTLSGKSFEYTGSEIKPSVKVDLKGTILKEGTHYTVAYKNNINPGTAAVTITGIGDYTGSLYVQFEIVKTVASLNNASVILSADTFDYTGEAIQPAASVVLNNTTLVAGKDYIVAYSENINPGIATVVITGTGNYSGNAYAQFQILEPAPVLPAGVIDMGMCGNAVSYVIYDTGLMVLSGSGNTFHYNSGNRPPYYEYRDYVTDVVIEGGISVLGQQTFTWFSSLNTVTFQEGVSKICVLAFSNTGRVIQVNLPQSVKIIEAKAFSGTAIGTVNYAGTIDQWNSISIDSGNEALYAANLITA